MVSYKFVTKTFENVYHSEKFVTLYNFNQPPKEIKIELYNIL